VKRENISGREMDRRESCIFEKMRNSHGWWSQESEGKDGF
jgi:hypothetical protein